MPKIETILVDNPGTPALGGGEPPIITMGAVLANAIYDADGVRLLQLPMTPVRVVEALERARAGRPNECDGIRRTNRLR